jgi:hypothetical protein
MGAAGKKGDDSRPKHRVLSLCGLGHEVLFSPSLFNGIVSRRSYRCTGTIAGSRYLDKEGGRDYSLSQEHFQKLRDNTDSRLRRAQIVPKVGAH